MSILQSVISGASILILPLDTSYAPNVAAAAGILNVIVKQPNLQLTRNTLAFLSLTQSQVIPDSMSM